MFNTSLLPPVFCGPGALRHVPRLASQSGERALIVHGSTIERSGQLDQLLHALAGRGMFATTMRIEGEPTVGRIDEITSVARCRGIHVIIAIGGGSALDAGKAVAALTPMHGRAWEFLEGVGTRKPSGQCLSWIAVPTTAGTGSEASSNAVLKGVDSQGRPYKRSLRHPHYLPTHIILDPTLSLGSPFALTAACAMDTLSQLLESFTSTLANPISDAIVWAGLTHSAHGLQALLRAEDSLQMRTDLALASLCSGFGLGNAGLGLVHGLAGHCGAIRDIAHGIICGALILPCFTETLQWLRTHPSSLAHGALEKFSRFEGLWQNRSTEEILAHFTHKLQLQSFSSLGYSCAELDQITLLGSNRHSPAQVSAERIRAILT